VPAYEDGEERRGIEALIRHLAAQDKQHFLSEFKHVFPDFEFNNEKAYIALRKFIDKHRFHSTIDYFNASD